MRFSPSRTVVSLTISAIGLAMIAGPALGHAGGDGDGHRGKVGRHAFIDSKDRPGARCFVEEVAPTTDVVVDVDPAVELTGVAVRPPRVKAINRTRFVDHQRVGWRFILLEKIGDGDWTKVKRSSLQIRRTTDRRVANFSRMAIRYDGKPDAMYRVKTKAYWFKPRLKPVGVATHLVDYYLVGKEVTHGACPMGIPEPVPVAH